jgi:GT2 family glycosyltransferase
MEAPQATIVVVARERFSLARRSLESIYEDTKFPFKLVYVDGDSPNSIKRYLEAKAQQKGFKLIRLEQYLSPNHARNLGLLQVKSKYVVFIENDVLVSPGWLEALVRCAEETGAWVVGPLYLMGEPKDQIIHMAGGLSHIIEQNGKRILYEEDWFPGIRLSDVPVPLKRKQCELVEFHCMLVRTEVFERIGLLDQNLLSVREHDDLCLVVRQQGGSVYLDPNAVVTYVYPPPLSLSDFSYFTLRWSETWIKATLQHFHKKWSLDMDENHPHYNYLWNRRYLFFRQFTKPLKNLIRRSLGREH